MEGSFDGVMLALAASFLLFGEGFFLAHAFLRPAAAVDGASLERVSSALVLPAFAILLGLIAACCGFQDQGAVVARSRESTGVLLGGALICCTASFVAVSAYVAVMLAAHSRGKGVACRGISWVCGALGAASILSVAMVASCFGSPWPSALLFATFVGIALLCGACYAIVACECAQGFSEARSMRRILMTLLCIGALLGLGGFIACVQASLLSAAVMDDQIMVQVTLAIFALTGAAAFALLALRSVDTGYHSVIAFVAAVIGSICALMAVLAI